MLFGPILSLLTFPGLIGKYLYEKFLTNFLNISLNDGEFDYSLRQFILKISAQFILFSLIATFFFTVLLNINPNARFEDNNSLETFILWLGLCFGIHSFPTLYEGKFVWRKSKQKAGKTNVVWKFVSLCIFGITIIDYFWGSILYSIGLFLIVERLVM